MKLKTWVTIIIVLMLVVLLVWPSVSPASKVWVTYRDIDINSGRRRDTRFILWCKVSEKEYDSELTKVLPEEYLKDKEAQWHRVITDCRGIKIHHAYHGGISQIRGLERLWEVLPFTDEAKQVSAINILKAWQQSKDYRTADKYLDKLGTTAFDIYESNSESTITVEQLPRLEDL